jgi:voltage-gated potassium channel Kch
MPPRGQKPLRDHLIVCGLGHVGYRIIELLRALGEPFAVVTRGVRPEWREEVRDCAARFVEGDARTDSCLRDAGIEEARAVLIVTNDDLINIEIALDVQRLNPNAAIIVRVFDRYLADHTGRERSVRSVLSPALLTAPVFVAAALGQEMLRTFTIDSATLHIARLPFTAASPDLDRPVEEFCSRYDLIPLAIHSARPRSVAEPLPHRLAPREAEEARPDPVLPSPCAASDGESGEREALRKRRLSEGDELLVAASVPAARRLQRDGYLPGLKTGSAAHSPSGRRLRAALNLIGHPIRTLRQVWPHPPWIALAVLSLLTALNVVVFHAGMPDSPSWIDALYFTITTMTTVGYGDYNLRDAPWWLKLYGCGVMIMGAALIAILFGLITDYIVSQRVAQALGQRQTKLTDHTVVVGLGDVGTRIVEELERIGEPVVAVERDADHEAVPTLQDHLHVIIGDANKESTLLQVNIRQARAVIVTTTNDLDSLRIAHRARMFNPELRSVIRLYDSALARKLGGELGIDRAVNAAATAAATFVACAFRPGVEQGFTLGKRLFVLRWLTPEEMSASEMEGQTVAALRERGYAIVMRSRGSGERGQTRSVSPQDSLSPGEQALILEEYLPERRAFVFPNLAAYSEGDLP